MLKSSLIKWAVAAALAVPAIPVLGSVRHHHKVVLSSRTHRVVSLTSKSHRLAKTHHRVGTLISRKKLSHRRHGLTKTTARHASLSTSTHFKVHPTKMPPTIDGIRA
jgi:hypothetical protein